MKNKKAELVGFIVLIAMGILAGLFLSLSSGGNQITGYAVAGSIAGVNVTTCNTTIINDSILTSSISCLGPADHGVIIGANDITLDCQGFSINPPPGFISSGYGVYNPGYNNVTVQNCQISFFYHGIYYADNQDGTIYNNTLFNNTNTINDGDGIKLLNSNYTLIEDNLAYNNFYNGIELSSSFNNLVVYNDAYNQTNLGISSGIYLGYSDFNNLSENIAYQNQYAGIALDDSDYNNISLNDARINTDYGISLYESDHNTFTSNNASSSSSLHGLLLFSNSDFNEFYSNYVQYNLKFGANINNSDNNTFADNFITGNSDYGLNLENSNGNTFYNNFINNTKNVNDNSVNTWNIPKTAGTNIIGNPYLGGNFWSDYNGTDLNGDGLGDTEIPWKGSTSISNGGDSLPLTSVNVACGGNLTSSTTLSQNISGFGNCLTLGADDITLDCAGYYLTGPFNNTGYGISFNNRKNITIKNCNIVDWKRGISGNSSSDIYIINNNLSNNLTTGLSIYDVFILGSNNTNIINNTMNSYNDRNINIESSATPCHGLTITGNVLTNIKNSSNTIFAYGTDTSYISNTLIANNHITGSPISCMYLNNSLIENNVVVHSITQGSSVGISTGYQINETIRNNNISSLVPFMPSNQIGLSTPPTGIYAISGSTIINNHIYNVTYGISNPGGGTPINLTIKDNDIHDLINITNAYSTYFPAIGLKLYGSNDNETGFNITLQNNTIFNNPGYDLWMEAMYGVNFSAPLQEIYILDSIITTYSISQVELVTFENSTFGKVRFVNITQNGTDLFGSPSSDIRIKNNSIFVNSTQAGLNITANLTHYGLSASQSTPFWDPEDDGYFTSCPVSICTNIIYNATTNQLSYTVAHFTTFIGDSLYPPDITDPTLTPSPAYTYNNLTSSTNYSDPNSELGTVFFNWTADGSQVRFVNYTNINPNSSAIDILTSANFVKNQNVTVYVWAFDGNNYSTTKSNSIIISNSLPSAPTISLTPSSPNDNDNLVCNVTALSTDLDSDTVDYTYDWYNNTQLFQTTGPTSQTYNTLNSSNTAINENWNCTVTPFDGQANGTSTSVAVTIQDITPPTSTISTLTNNSDLGKNSFPINISGTAVDDFNLSYIEVSINGTFYNATGTSTWNYSWTPSTDGEYQIYSRAVDQYNNNETEFEVYYLEVYTTSNITNSNKTSSTNILSDIVDSNETNSHINISRIYSSRLINITSFNCTINNSQLNYSYCYHSFYSIINVTGTNNNFSNANVTNSNVDYSNISDSEVFGSNITSSSVVNSSHINNSNITNSQVDLSNITDSTLTDSNLTNSYVEDSNLTNSNSTNSIIIDSNVTDSDVDDSNITLSDVDNSFIDDSNVTNSFIEDSNITNSYVEDSNLTSTNATDSTIINVNATDSFINNSDVYDSEIEDSTLNDVNVTNSTVIGSTLTNVTVINSTVTDSILNNTNITNDVCYSGTLVYQGTTYTCSVSNPISLTTIYNPPAAPGGGGRGPSKIYQCSDRQDNDGDGLIDWPNDPGCTNKYDDDETELVCQQSWICIQWGPCLNGTQTRICEDLAECQKYLAEGKVEFITEIPKPLEEQPCQLPPVILPEVECQTDTDCPEAYQCQNNQCVLVEIERIPVTPGITFTERLSSVAQKFKSLFVVLYTFSQKTNLTVQGYTLDLLELFSQKASSFAKAVSGIFSNFIIPFLSRHYLPFIFTVLAIALVIAFFAAVRTFYHSDTYLTVQAKKEFKEGMEKETKLEELSQALAHYITTALLEGIPLKQIKSDLIARGWPEKTVQSYLNIIYLKNRQTISKVKKSSFVEYELEEIKKELQQPEKAIKFIPPKQKFVRAKALTQPEKTFVYQPTPEYRSYEKELAQIESELKNLQIPRYQKPETPSRKPVEPQKKPLEELRQVISHLAIQGKSQEEIVALLVKNNWPADFVEKYILSYFPHLQSISFFKKEVAELENELKKLKKR